MRVGLLLLCHSRKPKRIAARTRAMPFFAFFRPFSQVIPSARIFACSRRLLNLFLYAGFVCLKCWYQVKYAWRPTSNSICSKSGLLYGRGEKVYGLPRVRTLPYLTVAAVLDLKTSVEFVRIGRRPHMRVMQGISAERSKPPRHRLAPKCPLAYIDFGSRGMCCYRTLYY